MPIKKNLMMLTEITTMQPRTKIMPTRTIRIIRTRMMTM